MSGQLSLDCREIGRRLNETARAEWRLGRLKVAGPTVGLRTLAVDPARLHDTVSLGAVRLHLRARGGARSRSHFLCFLVHLPVAPRLRPALVGVVARTIAGTDWRTDGLQVAALAPLNCRGRRTG